MMNRVNRREMLVGGGLAVLGGVAATGRQAAARASPSGFRVVGYLPDYRLSGVTTAVLKQATDVVYFSAAPRSDGELDVSRLAPGNLERVRKLAAEAGTRLHFTVGGWGHSAAFPQVAAEAALRERFTANLTRFCRENQFQGADLDWEHPKNAAEEENYGRLLTEIRKSFDPHALELSIAMAGWQKLPAEGFRAVHRVHLMSYDASARHSTYELAEKEIQSLLDRGVEPGKICLGLPFYGRGVEDRQRAVTYAEIVAKHRPAAEVDEVDGLFFNGPRLIERKTRLALHRRLAGIMVWELGQDSRDDSSLLASIRRTISTSR